MAKDKEFKSDYERALEDARQSMPIIMDRMTGEERPLFGKLAAKKEDDSRKEKKLPHQTKIMSAIIIPDWLQKALKDVKLDRLDLGDTDTLTKLLLAGYTHKQTHGIMLSLNKDGELTVFTTSGDPRKLSSEDSDVVSACFSALAKVLLGLGDDPVITEEVKPAKKETKTGTNKPKGKGSSKKSSATKGGK